LAARLRLNMQEATWVAPPPEIDMKTITFAALLLALSAVNAAPMAPQLGQTNAADSVMATATGVAQDRICLRCIR
jgi:hypothetical protein